jgi:hypothetical protein
MEEENMDLQVDKNCIAGAPLAERAKHVDVIFLVLDDLHTKYFLMEWQTTAVKSS